MLKEFKAFVMRGNVLDLAVAVIIGGAFGKIVASLVNDIIMPLIGLMMGRRKLLRTCLVTVGAAVRQMGRVRADSDRLHRDRLRDLPDRQGRQQDAEACACSRPRRTDHEGMSALLLDHSHQRHALSELYIGT